MPTIRKSNGPAAVRAKKAKVDVVARESAPTIDRNLAKLHEIVRVLETSGLAELRYEDEDVAIELRRHSSAPALQSAHAVMAPAAAAAAAHEKTSEANGAVLDANVHVMRSPFVGTFYASPSPGAEQFTAIGQTVRRGQTLCIIEAMKLMNEIESEVDGTVLEMLAENGQPVQYGDALFKIKTKG